MTNIQITPVKKGYIRTSRDGKATDFFIIDANLHLSKNQFLVIPPESRVKIHLGFKVLVPSNYLLEILPYNEKELIVAPHYFFGKTELTTEIISLEKIKTITIDIKQPFCRMILKHISDSNFIIIDEELFNAIREK